MPIIISILALSVSGTVLWRTHFMPFSLLTAAGSMTFRVHQMESSDESWRIPHFALSIDFTNAGSRIGRVIGMRCIVRYVDLPIEGARETFHCDGEFDAVKYDRTSARRLLMMNKSRIGDANPFVLLPKATVTKFYVFSTRWNRPVRQKTFDVDVEVLTDRSDHWVNVGTWQYSHMSGKMWDMIEEGMSFSAALRDPYSSVMHPLDLHKYTLDSDLETEDYESVGPSTEIAPASLRKDLSSSNDLQCG